MLTRQPSLFDPPPTPSLLRPIIFDFGLDDVYTPPAPQPPPRNPYLLTFKEPDELEVMNKWHTLPEDIRQGKLKLTFAAPVTFQVNRKKRKEAAVHVVRLFLGSTSGWLCYTSALRTGYQFTTQLSLLISIEPAEPKIPVDMIEKCKQFANRFHPNAWDDLKEKLLADPRNYWATYGNTVTSISGKFPKYVLEEIRQAFEEKSDYAYDAGSYHLSRKKGRDLSVSCKLCDNGIFRAWFHSYYPGSGNGDSWLLINPTTAIFKETD